MHIYKMLFSPEKNYCHPGLAVFPTDWTFSKNKEEKTKSKKRRTAQEVLVLGVCLFALTITIISLTITSNSQVSSEPIIVLSVTNREMDMLDNLLGGRGCGADGTLSRNPVTAMVDRIFESHAAADESGALLGGAHTGQEGYLYDESAVRSMGTADPTDWLRDFGLQHNGSMDTRADPVGFAGFNDRWTASSIAASDQSMNLMIQQQAMMSQMMQMQVSTC